MARCWQCERELEKSALDFEAVLVPRIASDGGPVYVYRCPDCGIDNVVERNEAGERLLSPPHLAALKTRTVRGKTLWVAKKWAADHREERLEFYSRTGPETERLEAPSEPAPAAGEPPAEAEDLSDASSIFRAYQVLDLPLSASQDEVKQRYRQLSKKCHPDRVADLDDEIRRVAASRFREITEAYELVFDQL